MGWMGEKKTMAEEHILIDDILKNQAERMLYLKKYYPFSGAGHGIYHHGPASVSHTGKSF